jgi:hypothetical protein
MNRSTAAVGIAAAWLVLGLAACGDSPSGPAPTPALAVNIAGLPAGAAASVLVTGPSGFSRELAATTTLRDLAAGTYTVTASEVTSSGGDIFRAEPVSQSVQVAASREPTPVAISYAQASGTVEITISGLPGGAQANIQVSGPGGTFTVVQGGALRGLAAGTYLVNADDVVVDGRSYGSTPPTQYVTVTAGAQVPVTVGYALRELNLFIAGVHLSQSVQRDDMSVPFIAGRDGYVRVFAQANSENAAEAKVRLRFLRGGVVIDSIDIGGVFSVPQEILPASWNRSWNAPVPGHLFQPGTSVIAEVDPENRIGERDETDNFYPPSGVPAPLNIVDTPPLRIRLIPVLQSNGAMGSVGEANKHAFMADVMKMFPLSGYEADVRSPYVASAAPVQANGTNWPELLHEINALRVAEGDLRYYYGVLNVSYTGGVAGIGFVPGKAALGWDRLPSAGEVLAHELGHNWGRRHAPCGNAGNTDPAYPYAGGVIGVFGIDVPGSRLRPPDATDIMGYCANVWISDYTYMGVLNYRATEVREVAAAPRQSLLLWGRMSAGELVLEPALDVTTRPSLPTRGGRYTLTGHDAAGRELFRLAFEPEQVNEHAPRPEAQFAFAVPLDESARRDLASIRLSGGGREVVRRVGAAAAATPPPVRFAAAAGATSVTWDSAAYPVVMLRDGRTGEVVSFARGGRAMVPVPAANLQAVASDGVRSATFGPARLPER